MNAQPRLLPLPEAELPELPDLEALLKWAQARKAHFENVRDDAQAEVDRADAYLTRLTGRKPAKSTPKVSPRTYRQLLECLGNHDYAGVNTLSGESGLSRTQVGRAMQLAAERGHAQVERARQGRHRYRLSEGGAEFVTGSD